MDFKKKILNPCQILLCCVQLKLGLFFSGFVYADAGSLLQHFAAAVFFVFDDVVNHAQFHDGIAVCADSRIEEKVMDVLQTALNIIQPVFTLTTFIELSGNGNSVELCRQKILGIVEGKAHFSQTTGTPGL